MGISMWFIFIILLPLLIMMVVLGKRGRANDEDDEEVGSGTYRGEEGEEMEEDSEGDDGGDGKSKTNKDNLRPLWKYVTRIGIGKGGGTIKFLCPHCDYTYTGSYTRVRRHLCGIMPNDDPKKNPGIKTCDKVDSKERAKYRKEDEEAQQRGKKTQNEHDTASSQRAFGG